MEMGTRPLRSQGAAPAANIVEQQKEPAAAMPFNTEDVDKRTAQVKIAEKWLGLLQENATFIVHILNASLN